MLLGDINAAMTVFSILSSAPVILLVYFLIENIMFYKSVEKLSTAEKLLKIVETGTGSHFPMRVRAWDGSETGSKGAPLFHFKSKSIIRWLIWSPRFPSLGIMRAVVDGNDLDIDGDFGADDFWQNIFGLIVIECNFLKYIQSVVTSLKMLLVLVSMFGWSLLCLAPPIPPEEFKPKSSFKKYTPNADEETCNFVYNYNFFEFMLGQTMVYTSAYYETPDMSLDKAQLAKLELACRKLGLKEGMTVLDIGCGWGSFLIYAAQKYGVTAKGITLSSEQYKYAEEKIKRLGLEKMVDVQLMDFRDLNEVGHYDAIASFGMMEHIGIKNHRLFVQTVHKLLKPGGKFLLQTCCHSLEYKKYEKIFTTPLEGHPIIERYFLPSGELDYFHAYIRSLDEAGLEVRSIESLREHLARTMNDWAKNLEEHEEEILKKGISPCFFKCVKLGLVSLVHAFRADFMRDILCLCTKANKEA